MSRAQCVINFLGHLQYVASCSNGGSGGSLEYLFTPSSSASAYRTFIPSLGANSSLPVIPSLGTQSIITILSFPLLKPPYSSTVVNLFHDHHSKVLSVRGKHLVKSASDLPAKTSQTALRWARWAPTSQSGLILSPTLEPFPQRLVDRVHPGQFVDMREFLIDNVSLMQQL